jgi:hypothetical protein
MPQPHPDRPAPRGKRAQAAHQVVPPQRTTDHPALPPAQAPGKSRRWPWMAGIVVAFVAGIDLTCSLPVKTALVDSQQRNFDPIDDLYKLKGNSNCNDNLQPGFESDMTWVYRVPSSATAIGWGFQDITDLSTPRQDWTTVRLQLRTATEVSIDRRRQRF